MRYATRHLALLYTVAGCDRAARLVEQLLTLSRLESAPRLRWVGSISLHWPDRL